MTSSSHTANGGSPTITALLQRLRADAVELLRAEVSLAKAEMVCAANQLLHCALLGLLGCVLLLVGVLALVAAAVIGLGHWLPLWAAACAVGLVLLLAGVLTFLAARNQLDAKSLALTHTRDSVQQDLGLVNRKAHEQAKHDDQARDYPAAREPHGPAALPH